MSTQVDLVLSRSEETPRSAPLDTVRIQELWLVLARWGWTTLVLLPAHADGSTQELASELARAGASLSDVPVSAVTASELEAHRARSIIALARRMTGRREGISHSNDVVGALPEPSGSEAESTPSGGEADSTPSGSEAESTGHPAPTFGKLIISVPSIAAGPFALAATNAADLVILGVEPGKTSFAEVGRSIDLIGRGRIAGCVLI